MSERACSTYLRVRVRVSTNNNSIASLLVVILNVAQCQATTDQSTYDDRVKHNCTQKRKGINTVGSFEKAPNEQHVTPGRKNLFKEGKRVAVGVVKQLVEAAACCCNKRIGAVCS